jgi:hypothetical protein
VERKNTAIGNRQKSEIECINLANQKYWIGYSTVNPQKLRNFGASLAFKF